MRFKARTVMVLLSVSIGRGLHAQADQGSALSLQGFSGVLNTPNGHVQREGTFDLLYSNQRDNVVGYGIPAWQDNFLFSVGMFNFVEVGGRLTSAPPFPTHSGIRDLSANWKVSSDPLTARFRFSPALAVGMQDVGGGAHLLGTKYVAGSVDPVGWLRLSAGYGSGPGRMKGAFGGMELMAHPWVTLLGDYDTSNTNLGVRLTAPALPYIPVRLTATFSSPVQNSQGLGIAGGLIIPLDFKKSSHHRASLTTDHGSWQSQKTLWDVFRARNVQVTADPASSPTDVSATAPVATPLSGVASPSPSGDPVLTAVPPPVPILSGNNTKQESPEWVREHLIKGGFVNVRVGLLGKTLVVEYENIRYNHNELDAIGVVTGIASQAAGDGVEDLRLVVKRRGLELLQIEAQLEPLRDWLQGDVQTKAPTLVVTQKLASEAGTNFVAGGTNPGRLRPSIMVYPSLITLVGTENGVFDYQLSIRPELQLPLWRGATGVARWDLPISWSGNLDDGQVYAAYRTPARMDRLMFFQAVTLAPGLVANLGAGKIQDTTNGTLNELSWTVGGGMNRFKAIQSWGRDSGTNRNVFLGSYRYFLARYDLGFEGVAGRFWGQDTGFKVSMQRFFGDASASLYFKDSKLQNGPERWLQAGIQLEFPLTPRRDMKARPIQIRGNQDWLYAQETGIASSSIQNSNYIQPGLAVVPEPAQALDLYFYDRERLNADYIRSHTERIKDAWRFFRDGV
ncbi:YjbH domain-containing protein [Terriglobus roseus]|nr:YjbH domain-containing protein [Terriglobus roseus]